MHKHRQILFLRVSFWVGVIIDGIVAIQLLLPEFWASFNGLASYKPNESLNFSLGIASALMWGWTALLIWADRKPLERKAILLLTTFPVIFGMVLNNVYAISSGLIAIKSILPTLLIQCVLAAFFTFSYFKARVVK